MKAKILFLLLPFATLAMAQQLTPECYVEVEPNRYVIHFTLPQYSLEFEDGNDYDTGHNYGEYGTCDDFTNIVILDDSDYDMTDIPGYPELPFFSLKLILPDNAHNIQVTYEKQDSTQEELYNYITPSYLGNRIVNHGNGDSCVSMDTGCFNSVYYTYGCDDMYPNGFYTGNYFLSPIYSIAGTTGVTISIFPFSYYPHLGYMKVLLEGTFYIDYEGGDVTSVIDSLDTVDDYSALTAKMVYSNFNNTPQYITSNGDLLIIASHSDMYETLDPYIYYKTLQNYNVEVVYLDNYSACGNSLMIEAIIHYYNPNFVLLVGNLNDIPPHWNCSIPSDGPYHPLVGRWVVNGEYGYYPELDRIILKTIDSEGYFTPYRSKASLFSGVDVKSRLRSKQFYKRMSRVVEESFGSLSLPYNLYDGRNPAVGFSTMAQDLQNNHPSFFLYGGHGTVLTDEYDNSIIIRTGISSPYKIFPDNYYNYYYSYHNIYELGNTFPYPMGFGFACDLNTYSVKESFGAEWVNSYSGGVSFYGATIESDGGSNDWLSRRMFRMFKKMTELVGNFPLSFWIFCAEYDYYFAFSINKRWRHIQMYNLIGDPTLYVYGMSSYGDIHYPLSSPRRRIYNDIKDSEPELLYSEIYTIDGMLLQTIPAEGDVSYFKYPQGIYIKKDIYNNALKTSKFIK